VTSPLFFFAQITINSYIANLAAVFASSDSILHGPRSLDELLRTTVCIPQYSAEDLAISAANPLLWNEGQQWGKRLNATVGVRVGAFVSPNRTFDPRSETLRDRMGLCGEMLRQSAEIDAPSNINLMAIMSPMSYIRDFLANGNCGSFVNVPEVSFTQMERAPHFIVPAGLPTVYLQTWNAVSKFISATESFQGLEQKYLRARFKCPDVAADSSAITLQQQSGARSCSVVLLFAAFLAACATACCFFSRPLHYHAGLAGLRGNIPRLGDGATAFAFACALPAFVCVHARSREASRRAALRFRLHVECDPRRSAQARRGTPSGLANISVLRAATSLKRSRYCLNIVSAFTKPLQSNPSFRARPSSERSSLGH
jgi:hypothetical protein